MNVNIKIIIAIIVLFSLSGCTTSSEKTYSYTFSLEVNIEEPGQFYVLIPINFSQNQSENEIIRYFKGNINEIQLHIEKYDTTFFYNISSNSSFKINIYEVFHDQKTLELFLSKIPKLNYSFSPISNKKDFSFFIFLSEEKESPVNIKIDMNTKDVIDKSLNINGTLISGWNELLCKQNISIP